MLLIAVRCGRPNTDINFVLSGCKHHLATLLINIRSSSSINFAFRSSVSFSCLMIPVSRLSRHDCALGLAPEGRKLEPVTLFA